MTCVKLESLVQALSTSCCFVSNFEIQARLGLVRTRLKASRAILLQRNRNGLGHARVELASNHLKTALERERRATAGVVAARQSGGAGR